ncbi:hypothetical protein DM02DRAFT_618858 [Periconia macrospinosa]|uniref:Uncharacterized protein n=1 Tax=Periconia macrospinosa TaxID=97972 RepID=A0A2V1D7J9_9PLEO|nr:hypothetical protein DM02DRAFT_618858 [Periconia macrospinosa]
MAHTNTDDDEPGPRTLETTTTGPSPLVGVAVDLPQPQRGGGPSPNPAPPLLHPPFPSISSSSPTLADDAAAADDDDDSHDPRDASVAVNGAEAVSATAAGGAPQRQLPASSTLATPALLPPTLTPATTLGVLSSLHPSVHELPLPDLTAASTSSVPSTTTTLTNVLPPTQSAALRALNAPAFQSSLRPPSSHPQSKSKSAKSTSSRTTLSSQPVVVRTYSGSRHKSRHSTSSAISAPRYMNMNRPSTSHHPNGNSSALSAGLADARQQPKLPAIESFSFSAILRAVDPEIRDAIDAIAEICARSRYSLADEYDAHLPPQGEITVGGVREIEASRAGNAGGRTTSSSSSRGRLARIGQGWSAATAERTLVSVPEASSSSERSVAGEGSRKSSLKKGRSQSAYGSLKSVISGGSGSGNINRRRKSTGTGLDDFTSSATLKPLTLSQSKHNTTAPLTPTWSIISPLHPPNQPSSSSDQPHRSAITITTSLRASHQLSLDTSSTIKNVPPSNGHGDVFHVLKAPQNGHTVPRPQNAGHTTAPSSKGHARNASGGGGALAALASWVPMWTGRLTRGADDARANGHSRKPERGRDEDLMLGEVKERLRGMLKGDGAAG